LGYWECKFWDIGNVGLGYWECKFWDIGNVSFGILGM